MIGAATGSVRGFYQMRFITAVRGIMKELCRLLWHDKITQIPGSLSIPGTNLHVPDSWLGAADTANPQGPPRLGEFDDYALDVEPYSTSYQPPQQRAQVLGQMWQELMAGAPIFAASGIQLDPRRYLQLQARYRNMPELLELISSNNAPMELGGGEGASQIGKPGGNYTHTSVSGNQVDQGQQALSMMSPAEEAA
jgi:hypothetical protein